MASVYRRKSGFYYITLYVRPGQRKTVRGCRDKAATEALARKLETEAWQRKAGLVDEKDDRYTVAKAGRWRTKTGTTRSSADTWPTSMRRCWPRASRRSTPRRSSSRPLASWSSARPNACPI